MSNNIHATAIIDPGAELGSNVSIGPFTIVENDVVIGDGCQIGPHAVLGAGTRMGNDCKVFHGAAVGLVPQDLKFGGEKTLLNIGDRTVIREFCTLNRGTLSHGSTDIGADCLIMAYCHVAHDCLLGNNVIMSNTTQLAGHVTIGNTVTIGGMSAVHQFCRIGDFSMVGASSWVTQDIPPYALCSDTPVKIIGVNKVKLERMGYPVERREKIKRLFKMLFRRERKIDDAVASVLTEYPADEDAKMLTDFIAASERGLMRM